jgi:ligand-binding sensor domain-containing protein
MSKLTVAYSLSLPSLRSYTVWASGIGTLWQNSGAGFSRVEYPDEALDSIVAVASDRHNDPWIVARSGRVYRYFRRKWSNQNRALGRKPGVIGAMTDDAAGNIWLAFSDRVVKWDGTAYHASVRRARGVSDTTMSIRGDHVWLGGPGGVQLLLNGEFHTMQWKDAAMPGRVSGLVETQSGDLWINGFSGITHVRADELRR